MPKKYEYYQATPNDKSYLYDIIKRDPPGSTVLARVDNAVDASGIVNELNSIDEYATRYRSWWLKERDDRARGRSEIYIGWDRLKESEDLAERLKRDNALLDIYIGWDRLKESEDLAERLKRDNALLDISMNELNKKLDTLKSDVIAWEAVAKANKRDAEGYRDAATQRGDKIKELENHVHSLERKLHSYFYEDFHKQPVPSSQELTLAREDNLRLKDRLMNVIRKLEKIAYDARQP